ncbi:MAG: hypothetical protein WBG90_18015 [Saonia sp.]
MMEKQTVKPKMWFWILSVLALIWNLMGVMAYLAQAFITEEALDALPETERALYDAQPAWVTAAFAIAVFGGTLGCIALLLRKKWARPVLLISLIGILAQMSHAFFISNNFEVYGPGGLVMPILVIIIGVGLVLMARSAQTKGWIK